MCSASGFVYFLHLQPSVYMQQISFFTACVQRSLFTVFKCYCLKAAVAFLWGLMLYVEVTGVNCGRSGGRALLRQRRHDSICQIDPGTSLLIAPSSDAASNPNWQNVGVDGIKMAAVLFTSMTAACHLYLQKG